MSKEKNGDSSGDSSDTAASSEPKNRPRSPNRPSFDLGIAVEKARVLYDKYARAQIAIGLAASNWGYSNPRSGGALTLVATLKSFGLIDVSGQGLSQKVSVSEAGERIIRSAPDKVPLLQTAALAPAIHTETWDNFGKQLPHDDLIKQYLLWERSVGSRFTDDAVDPFISQLRTTLRFAGLIAADGSSVAEHKNGVGDTTKNGNGLDALKSEVQVGSFVQWACRGVLQFPEPVKVAQIVDGPDGKKYAYVEAEYEGALPVDQLTIENAPAADTLATLPPNPFFKKRQVASESEPSEGIACERKKLDEGYAEIRWPDEISKDSFEEFEYWITGILNRARRKAGIERIKTVKIV